MQLFHESIYLSLFSPFTFFLSWIPCFFVDILCICTREWLEKCRLSYGVMEVSASCGHPLYHTNANPYVLIFHKDSTTVPLNFITINAPLEYTLVKIWPDFQAQAKTIWHLSYSSPDSWFLMAAPGRIIIFLCRKLIMK